MTLEEAVDGLERRVLRVHEFEYLTPGDHNAIAPTGEPYVTMTPGGEKHEGGYSAAMCRSPEIAAQLWSDAVQRYCCNVISAADGRSDRLHLYWRMRPEVESDIFYTTTKDPPHPDVTIGHTLYTVYSRLLISDKPVKD